MAIAYDLSRSDIDFRAGQGANTGSINVVVLAAASAQVSATLADRRLSHFLRSTPSASTRGPLQDFNTLLGRDAALRRPRPWMDGSAGGHFANEDALRAKGPTTSQPRATPWENRPSRAKPWACPRVSPFQGLVLGERKTQGDARASLTLGWLVCAPLVLAPDALQCA